MEGNWQVIFRVFDTRSGEWIRDFTHINLSESEAKELEKKYKDDVIQYNWDKDHNVTLILETLDTPPTSKNVENSRPSRPPRLSLKTSTPDMD